MKHLLLLLLSGAMLGCGEQSWEVPRIIVRDTNLTQIDMNSLKGCRWDRTDRDLKIIDGATSVSFGYKSGGWYYLASFETSSRNTTDDSAWAAVLNKSGNFDGAYAVRKSEPMTVPQSADFVLPP